MQIPGFRLLEPLGRSELSQVYRAEAEDGSGQCVLKIAPASLHISLTREAEVGALLRHKAIVRVYRIFPAGDRWVLQMEYSPGQTLDQAMAAGEVRVGRLLPIAEALDYAHGRGIVHCDVKPGNILLTPGGGANLLDFGISKPIGIVQTVNGTPAYMAPERISADPAALDGRSDQYSLALVAWKMIGGSLPFRGETAREMMIAAKRDPLPRLCIEGAEAPEPVQAVLRRALAKEPAQRFESCVAFLDSLTTHFSEPATRKSPEPSPLS